MESAYLLNIDQISILRELLTGGKICTCGLARVDKKIKIIGWFGSLLLTEKGHGEETGAIMSEVIDIVVPSARFRQGERSLWIFPVKVRLIGCLVMAPTKIKILAWVSRVRGGSREDIRGEGSGKWWRIVKGVGWLDIMLPILGVWPVHFVYCNIVDIVVLS